LYIDLRGPNMVTLHSENIEQHEKETESETLLEAEIIVARNLNTNEIHDEPLPSVTETRTTDTPTGVVSKVSFTLPIVH
jgi:hypothetical protein